MKRLVAYAQNESANIVVNGNFTEIQDDFSFYEDWSRSVTPAGDLPSATSLPNPIDDTFNSVVRFHGSATNSSRITQTVPCEVGVVYQVRYKISAIRFGTDNEPNDCRFIGIATSPTVGIPNTVGVHKVNVMCEQANDDFGFEVESGYDSDTMLDWIEIVALTQYELDLFEDEEVVLTYEIDDIRNIDSKNSGYSKSFSIPASKQNSKFFQQIYSLSDGGNWNPYAKCQSIMYAEGIEVFKGFLKLDDIVKRDNHAIYNITLFEEVADLKTELGNKTLGLLPWESLIHEYTRSNIVNSWTGELVVIDGDQETDVVKYPYCNYIGNFDFEDGHTFLNNFNDAFRPWVKAKWIWDKIFEQSSFAYTSTFLNTNKFNKLYVDWNFNESFSAFGGGNTDFAQFRVDTDFETVFADADSVPFAYGLPNFDSVTNVGTAEIGNENNDYFSLTDQFFTATEDNQTVYVYVDALLFGGTSCDLLCAVEHNSTVAGCLPNQYFIESTPVVSTTVTDQTGTQHTWSNTDFVTIRRLTQSVGTFTLNAGETLTVKLRRNINVGTHKLGFATAMFEVSSGIEVNLGTVQSRTKIKQFDFVKAIVQMFNLVIVPNESNPKFLKIEPAVDYYESGETLDWTKKIDIEEINIMPHEVAQEYIFRMKHDDQDYNLEKYLSNNGGKYYGQHTKTHDFEVISKDIEEHVNTLFSPTVIDLTHGQMMPQIYGKEDGEFVEIENNIRILYDTGVQNCKKFSSNEQNGAKFNEQLTAGFFAPYQSYMTETDDLQVDYGQSLSFTNTGNIPIKTLYFEYYSDIINQLTRRESRIVKVRANLSSQDINNFEFKDTIFIENQLYRVNKIDYNSTEGELSTVELIKLSSETNFVFDKTHGKPCDAYPSAITMSGIVIFNQNGTTDVVAPTEDCCEEFGYEWTGYPHYNCRIKGNHHGHGYGHGHGVGHHDSSWSGGHHIVIGNKDTIGFGHNTHNSLIIGNKNTAQSNTKNIQIVGEKNNLGSDIRNTIVVGEDHKVDTPVNDVETGTEIHNSLVTGQRAFVKSSNTNTFAMSSTDGKVLQKVECIYFGDQTSDALTEIFLNGVSGNRYPLQATNSFVTLEIDVHGIVSDSSSRDYGKYIRRRLIATGGVVGGTKIRIDDTDEVSHHANHGSSWTTTIDVTSDSLRIQCQANGVRELTKWVAHVKVLEQDF